jgi:hypothetical protein
VRTCAVVSKTNDEGFVSYFSAWNRPARKRSLFGAALSARLLWTQRIGTVVLLLLFHPPPTGYHPTIL